MTEQSGVLLCVGQEATKIWILIVLGYVARRSGFISPDAAVGIGQIAGRVALPALIFHLVAAADLGSVDWRIVGCMQLCQVAASAGAGLMALVAGGAFPEVPRVSLAGAFALFVANVDYTAVGVPLIQSIFPADYLLYLYMFLLINVCVIVPCTFLVMEIGSRRGDISDQKCGALLLMKESMTRVITNPIVVAGVLGMAWNLCTGGAEITGIANDTLVSLGAAFRTCALFNLGMGIVGRVHDTTVRDSVVPVALALWKSLALPVLARSVTTAVVGDFAGKFVFVCGIVGSAASTPLMISMFLPKMVDTMRLSTIVNLVLSMPLFLIAAVVYSSSWDHAQAFLDFWRRACDIGSVGALVVIVAGFAVVPRWRRYPMLLVLDLPLLCIPFHVTHELCITGVGLPQTYIVENICRLTRLAYVLGLALIMVAVGRWEDWYPKIPWGYPESTKLGGGAAQQLTCEFHRKLRRMHWTLRLASLAYGTFFTLVFVGRRQDQYMGCWVEYGDWQWKTEFVGDIAFFVIQVGLMIVYLRTRRTTTERQAHGVLTRIGILIWCGAGHLYISAVLAFKHLGAPLDPLGFGSQLLLILDILLFAGGGMIVLLVLQSVYGVGPSVEALALRLKRCVLGARRSDELRLWAARIASDPSIEVFLVEGLGVEATSSERPASLPSDGFAAHKAGAGPTASISARLHRTFSRRRLGGGARPAAAALPSAALENSVGHGFSLAANHRAMPGFKLAAVTRWLGQNVAPEPCEIVNELVRMGLLEKAVLFRKSSMLGNVGDNEEYCLIHLNPIWGEADNGVMDSSSGDDGSRDFDSLAGTDEEGVDASEEVSSSSAGAPPRGEA